MHTACLPDRIKCNMNRFLPGAVNRASGVYSPLCWKPVMNPPPKTYPPNALMLLAPGCPHCPTVLEGLARLLKEGRIGRLEAVNVAALPEYAETLGVRSVPWIRIGPFELEGAISPAELRQWAELTNSEAGMAAYFDKLLANGRLHKVRESILDQPARARALLDLLGEPRTSMHVRLGIGAVLEDLRGTELLGVDFVHTLGALTRHPQAQIRADACHYLMLTENAEAIPYARACLADDDAEVREIAAEALTALEDKGIPRQG